MMRKLIKAYSKPALMFAVIFAVCAALNINLSSTEAEANSEGYYNPYKRTKHGPPLKNVTHKVGSTWLFDWLKDPKQYDPNSKMPNLQLEDGEVEAVMAYLASIADKDFPKAQWDSFVKKPDAELSDDEYDALDKLIFKGKGVWGVGRCNICHAQKGVGGFVTVAPDLGSVASKINIDWLYFWLTNPRDYFPHTMMPQYRMSDDERRALAVFILKDYDFLPEEDDDEDEESEDAAPVEITYSTDASVIEKGKNIITVSRCVVCHDIEGIDEVLPVQAEAPVPKGDFAKLVYEIRCLTCHNIRGEGGTYAPELTHAGSKLTESWLAAFLKSPDIIRPISQQMPKFYLSGKEARIATDYIKENFVSEEIQSGRYADAKVDEGRAEKGKAYFTDYGCNACHAVGALGGVIGPNLDRAGERLEPNYMFSHLKDPQHAGLDTPEPRYKLGDDEITNMLHFLLTCVKKDDS